MCQPSCHGNCCDHYHEDKQHPDKKIWRCLRCGARTTTGPDCPRGCGKMK